MWRLRAGAIRARFVKERHEHLLLSIVPDKRTLGESLSAGRRRGLCGPRRAFVPCVCLVPCSARAVPPALRLSRKGAQPAALCLRPYRFSKSARGKLLRRPLLCRQKEPNRPRAAAGPSFPIGQVFRVPLQGTAFRKRFLSELWELGELGFVPCVWRWVRLRRCPRARPRAARLGSALPTRGCRSCRCVGSALRHRAGRGVEPRAGNRPRFWRGCGGAKAVGRVVTFVCIELSI